MTKAIFLIQTMLILLTPLNIGNFNGSSTNNKASDANKEVKARYFGRHQQLFPTQNSQSVGADQLNSILIEEARKTNHLKIQKVVIDAGHGGHDPGTSGRYVSEKEVALKIALNLAKKIALGNPDVEVLLTRNKDVFIPLHERAEIANKAEADLFISIHCNAMPGSSATFGTETYVLGNHRMEDNLQVAIRENSSILLEQNFESIYNFNPNSPEAYIIMSMFQDSYQEQSISFAQMVEDNIQDVGNKKSRGVKQAGFLVLRETAMPSVLIETGFLSNRSDEQYLNSPLGQDEIAASIASSFQKYKNEIEYITKRGPAAQVPPVSAVPYQIPDEEFTPKSIPDPFLKSANTQSNAAQKMKDAYNQKKKGRNAPLQYSSNTGFESFDQKDQVIVKIQLAASTNPLNTQGQPWQEIEGALEVMQDAGFYKYLLGAYTSYEQARKDKIHYNNNGFPGAFLVYYLNDKRITREEAFIYLD